MAGLHLHLSHYWFRELKKNLDKKGLHITRSPKIDWKKSTSARRKRQIYRHQLYDSLTSDVVKFGACLTVGLLLKEQMHSEQKGAWVLKHLRLFRPGFALWNANKSGPKRSSIPHRKTRNWPIRTLVDERRLIWSKEIMIKRLNRAKTAAVLVLMPFDSRWDILQTHKLFSEKRYPRKSCSISHFLSFSSEMPSILNNQALKSFILCKIYWIFWDLAPLWLS